MTRGPESGVGMEQAGSFGMPVVYYEHSGNQQLHM